MWHQYPLEIWSGGIKNTPRGECVVEKRDTCLLRKFSLRKPRQNAVRINLASSNSPRQNPPPNDVISAELMHTWYKR